MTGLRVGAIAILLAQAALARDSPVRIAPARDAALASVVLLASGAESPVLLYQRHAADLLQRAVREHGGAVECFVRRKTPPESAAALHALSGAPCTTVADLGTLARQLWPNPTSVVFAAADDYPWLLRGAALAGALGGALVPVEPGHPFAPDAFAGWRPDVWYAVGDVAPTLPAEIAPTRLADADAVTAVVLAHLAARGRTVVVANPADRRGRFAASSLSLLSPLIAATHHAPLILVGNSASAVVETEVRRAIALSRLTPSHIYLVGDELALRSHRVPDPVLAAGGPEAIDGARDVRVELFSEIQEQHPQAYAVGRFVGEDAARASITLAKQLHPPAGDRGPVVFLSNADVLFPLGETISRSTVSDVRNADVPVRAEFQTRVTPEVIRDAMQRAGTVVWEGHVRDLTLKQDGGIAVERTPPFVVLQGCSTLDRSDPFVLLERGTEAMVGTTASIYSASGSAFARALFDALLYDRDDLGTAVRDARNYLLALAKLKRARGHKDWTKTYRAALAFALWGDPAAPSPLPPPRPKHAPVSWQVGDRQLLLTIPPKRLKTARVGRYLAQPPPRAMLGGLVLRDGDAPERRVKELFFTAIEVPPGVGAACAPNPDWQVVSQYAAATRTLSILVRPPGDALSAPAPAGTFALPLVSHPSECP